MMVLPDGWSNLNSKSLSASDNNIFFKYHFYIYNSLLIDILSSSSGRSSKLISGPFIFLFFFIFPVLPSGSFFGSNYGVPFWLNLSIVVYFYKIKK